MSKENLIERIDDLFMDADLDGSRLHDEIIESVNAEYADDWHEIIEFVDSNKMRVSKMGIDFDAVDYRALSQFLEGEQ